MNTNMCPTCGYEGLYEPPRSDSGSASYEICPCCGFQFGVSDDDEGYSYLAWRQSWINDGMNWFSDSRSKPNDWNPYRQLERAGFDKGPSENKQKIGHDKELTFDFIWIPTSLGGHNGDPWIGMRVQIRWQKYVEAYLQCIRDVQCESLVFDSKTLQGTATCFFGSDEPIPPEWLREGELIELLSGFRVLAVGRIRGGS